jgi:hypothetical protein
VPNFSTHNNDRDNDGDHNDDDARIVYFGHTADTADRRSSVSLLTRYFAAAAAGNGAAGCAQLAPFLAESLAEEYGRSSGLRGATCPAVLSKLFRLHRGMLVRKWATLRVVGVRVEGDRALAILYFGAIPETRQMTERRVGGVWRLVQPFDGLIE